VPVDLVFVCDCTGSMKGTLLGAAAAAPGFAEELRRANLEVRFGLVGFQDTTLGQPLKIPPLDGQRMSPRGDLLGLAIRDLRLGGGGGEGESSLDGVAEAADFPLRENAVRVVVLITDGAPKRIDGRMKSMDETVKYLRARKVDQLQIVALPEHRKPFEALRTGARGQYFDLRAAREAGAIEKLISDVAKAIVELAPQLPPIAVEPVAPAPEPTLPLRSEKPLVLPPGADAEEPEQPREEEPVVPEEPERTRASSFAAWAIGLVSFVCMALLFGQWLLLPRGSFTVGTAAAGYGLGVILGGAAGAAATAALDQLGLPYLGRAAGALVFGLCFGSLVPLGARLFPSAHAPGKDTPVTQQPEPRTESLVVPRKPNIAPPRPRDGCPGCGRTIPGSAGERYCMLCDLRF
jgi:hypothetical protein